MDVDLESDDLEGQFSRAADYVAQNHDKPELQGQLLQYYGLYKQGGSGDCNTKRPSMFQMTAKAKWDSWNQLKGMTRKVAMDNYVKLLTTTVPDWSLKKASWVSVSSQSIPPENIIPEDAMLLSDFIKEGDVDNFLKHLTTPIDDINDLDEAGLGLIHWAADRNQLDVLRILLGLPGLNINLQDSEGQTALHYAASCGHKDCLELLLEKGADKMIVCADGSMARDIACDDSIVNLLL